MDQYIIRRLGSNRLKPRTHAVFPGGTARHHGQAGQAFQQAGDIGLLTGRGHGLQGGHQTFGQKRLGRMAQHGPAEQGQELLGPRRTKAAAMPGREKKRQSFHAPSLAPDPHP